MSIFEIFCLLQLFKLMQILVGAQKGIKNDQYKSSVLNFPDKNQLKQIFSPSKDLKIFYYAPKNTTLALSQFNIEKSKLKNNLEIFQWRNQTQFPVVKTSLVKIKQKIINETEVVCLSVYYQHCPLRINQIYQIPINQSIYLLKEALLGFQRLYNRYGGFDVQNSMIALNQKRKCKVWMNQEFYLNTFYKREISENKMVSKIIAIIQSHSQESKTAKNLFLELRKYDTFFEALRAIEFFIQSQKILVPNQFTKNQAMKIYQKVDYFTTKVTKNKPWNQFLNFRVSLKQRKFNFYEESPEKDEKNKNRSPSFLKNRKNTNSTNFKRSKSQKIVEMSSVLQNEKKQTENEPFFQTVGYFGSQVKNNQVKYSDYPPQSRKIENFSTCSSKLKINMDDIQMSKQQRKYSQAFKSKEMKSTFQSSNDYTQKIVKNYTEQSPSAYQYFSKASIDKPFYQEFEQLFKNNEEQQIVSPKIIVKEPKVYKSNGWINKVSGLMDSPGKLETSYQQEQPQPIDTKRSKFNNIHEISIFQIETQAQS